MKRQQSFSHSIVAVFACLSSSLMPGSFGQKPVLSVGTFTSTGNLGCIKPGDDTVTLEASVNLNGSDVSTWLQNGVEFRSPQLLICTASLNACPPSSPPPDCYCERFDNSTETYTVKLTKPAQIIYSEQYISIMINKSDSMESASSGQAIYPYVREDVRATIYYGSKSKSVDIDRTDLDIPVDDQFLNMTISGLKQNFNISYSTNIIGSSHLGQNMNHVSIPLTSSTDLLTLRFEEEEYCKRVVTYSFTVKSVHRQSPYLDVEITNTCPVEGQGLISLDATVNFTGVNQSDWSREVLFISEDNQELCRASLVNCASNNEDGHECYCHHSEVDVFTVMGILGPISSLSGKDIHMDILSSDSSILQRSESVTYPLISHDDVQILMVYENDNRNRRYNPPVNNSILEHPEDNQRLTVTVSGLKEPFSIVCVKGGGDFHVTNNQSSVTFDIEDDVKMIQVYYDEDIICHRKAEYFFTFEDDDSDDLSTGAIVGIIFGGILFVVIIIFFIIVYLLARAKAESKERYQRSSRFSIEERGGIIDYTNKDVENGRVEENGRSYENKAYDSDLPANSSTVVVNPVYDEEDKVNEYTSLDAATQNEPGPSYESLNNGKPAGSSPAEEELHDVKPAEVEPVSVQSDQDLSPTYTDLVDEKPADTTSGDDDVNGAKPSRQGPYVSIIRTSL